MKPIALVTGGSRGIGRAISIRLSEMGFHVLVNYMVNMEEAGKTLDLMQEKGGSGELIPFDVSSVDEVEQKLGEWKAGHAEEFIQVLVNNAGIRQDNLMIFMENRDWQKVLDTNLGGFYNVTRYLLKDMMLN